MSSIVHLNKAESTFDMDCNLDCRNLALQCWQKADLKPTEEGAMYQANAELRSLLEVVTRNSYRPAEASVAEERRNVRMEALLANL
eukprot:4294654-Pleurochrysis_carterae.AAC.1